MHTSPTLTKIAPALVKAQSATGAALKSATNPFFKSKYADLGSIMEACKGPFNANGITILQPVVGANVETVLIHESGEWIESSTPIMCKDPSDPQKFGSAISYARRYGLQAMVLIPAEDDDGESAKLPGKPSAAPMQVPLDPNDPIDAAIANPTSFDTCPECRATRTASRKIFHKPDCTRKETFV